MIGRYNKDASIPNAPTPFNSRASSPMEPRSSESSKKPEFKFPTPPSSEHSTPTMTPAPSTGTSPVTTPR